VIDTNIWISFLLTNRILFTQNLLQNPKLVILACQVLFSEVSQVLRRPKFKKYIKSYDIERFEEIFRNYALNIILKTNTKGKTRDEKDDFLLALAFDGNADYLVTGDKDLLVLGHFESTQMITLRYFMDEILPKV